MATLCRQTLLVIMIQKFIEDTMAWQLVYQTFGNKAISITDIDGWINPISGNSAQITSCGYNGFQSIWLSGPNKQAQKCINNIPPHYQVKSIQDLYFYYSFNSEYSDAYIDSTQIFYKVWSYTSNMDYYGNICDLYPVSYTFDLFTVIGIVTPHTNDNLCLKYTCDLDQAIDNEAVYIRNVQVYIEPCYETCLTCSGKLINNCLTCHYLIPIGGKCDYCSSPSLSFTHSLLGCIQECPEYYLADQNHFCVFNQKIYNQFLAYQNTLFTNEVFEYIEDSTIGGAILIHSKIQTCNSISVSGYFHYRDALQKLITLPNGTFKIRIRLTSYLFNNWADQQQLSILINQVQVDSIFYNSGILQIRNGQILHKLLGQTCNINNYDLVRIETNIIMNNPDSSILLEFQASGLVNELQSWGIRDITVDVLVCSFNCDLCDNENNCKTCSSGYKLHKGQCIQNCPSYSTAIGSICKDFDEETDMTKYEVKAFYDLSTNDEEANNMFSLVSQNTPNFAKGSSIYFSYLDNKRIFGGTLVWRKAKFQKIISITEPHHGIRLRMNVILGDDFSGGSFIYTINSAATTLTRSTPGGIDQQIWGSYQNEYQISVDTNKISNTLSGSYTLSVECLSNKAINVAWCGISDLFITVYRCPFQCGSCTNDATCNSQLGASHYDPILSTCSDGYYKDYNANDCKQCQRPYCQKCDDLYTCTECDSTFTLTIYGTCSCQDNQTILSGQCVDCHPLCQTCFDSTSSSCLQCTAGNHRFLAGSQCQCLPYFREVGSSKCEPICGDMVVVGDEECDDGNENRFDGCHKCKYECQEECTDCLNGVCHDCREDFVLHPIIYKCYPKEAILDYTYPEFFNTCGDGIKQGNEECDDGNMQPFDGCHNCQYSCVEHCQNCIMGSCIRCKTGWLYDEFTFACLEIQQPTYSTIPYQMDYYDSEWEKQFCTESVNGVCLKCNANLGFQLAKNRNFCYYSCRSQPVTDWQNANLFQETWISECDIPCPQNCIQCSFGICQQCQNNYYLTSNECISQCGDLAVVDLEECDDNNEDQFDGCWKCQYSCDLHCSTCIQGFCIKCHLGYEINYSSGVCEPICGDSLITGREQCDDSSNNCHDCNFKCTQYCKDCIYGVCLNCQDGFKLINGFCETQCGDGILNEQEECDDGNDIQFDGCFNCKKDCPKNCQECTLDHCQQCETGWTLNLIIEECEPYCGDGLVRGQEFCDDGNDTPFDGCYECEFQCQLECDYCYFGVCYECIIGWGLNNHSCQPICGDGLVMGTEQCDDGNDEPYDGCHQCQYSCDRNCLDCDKGICVLCQVGYIESGPSCLSICGDGKVALGNEYCDDSNNLDGDGCSSDCKIENGWVCIIDSLLSHCELSDPPLMYLDVVDDGEKVKIVEIKFSQKLLQSEVPTQFKLSLISNELSDDDFTLKLITKQVANYFEQVEVVYEIEIEYFKNCLKSQLVVEIVDQDSLINQFDQSIANQIVKAKLQQTNFLEDYQKQISQGINSMVNTIFYGIIVLFGISLLSGNLNIMWNTLDLLQFLSYLKYVNVPFPSNLQYFFSIFDQVALGPILNLTGFRKLMYYLQGSKIHYIEPSQRFAQDNINALLMDNIASVIFAILLCFAFHYIQIASLKLLQKIDLMQQIKQRQFVLLRILIFIKQELRLEINQFYFSELLRLFLSLSYDLYFTIYLQLCNLNFSSSFLSINSTLSIIILLFVIVINLKLLLFNFNNLQVENKNKQIQRILSLFEDVSTHSYFSTIFNSLFLLRRNFFIFILIFVQHAPLIQTLLIAFNSSIFFIYLYISNPQRNEFHAINIRFTEIVVQCCCSIFMIFEINNNYQQLFYSNVYLILGWICIGLISGCLFCQFVLDLYQQIIYLRNKYKQFISKNYDYGYQHSNCQKNIYNHNILNNLQIDKMF